MRKLVLILLACLLACVAAADVAVETQSGVASLSADFAAEVQNAIDAQSDESVAEDEAADEEEDQADAESEDEAPVLLETVAEGETEAEADSEVVESLESDLADLDAAEEELEHIDQLAAGVEEESDTELAAEADSESLEELENELNNFADQADQLEAAVDETAVSSFIESYDEVAADTMMDADPSMRLAQAGQEGFFDSIKKAASSAAKAVGGAAKKVVSTVAKSGVVKAISSAGKAAGKALVAAGKKVASGALKAVKKIAHKVANSGLGKLAKKALKGALKIGKKIAKKAFKVAKKIAKIMIRQIGRKYINYKHRKYCRQGPEGKKCRVKRCKAHRLGCHHKCKNGGWSRRRIHSSLACKNRGGVHPDYKSFDLSDAQELALDIEQGVVLPNGAPGPYANSHPPKGVSGTTPTTTGTGSVTAASTGANSLGTGSGSATGSGINPSGVNPDGTKMWDGVKPRFPGQPDLPPVRRLPEDVEDCVACQYVWKQVEQDVGNSPITQTIYDSFHANALDAQRTPVFYPACQTMFDAVDDMIGDYMEGYTVDQVCENSMLCRPRDLNQFLRHQRATKGI